MRQAVLAVIAIASVAAGIWAGRGLIAPRPVLPPEIAGAVLVPARPLPEFTLLDGHGESFRREDFLGAWSFLYFGYTYCPDVCPLSLLVLANVKKTLTGAESGNDGRNDGGDDSGDDSAAHAAPATHAGTGSKLGFYLVSVDPARDTPKRIDEYVTYFDPSFGGLTGDLGQIDQLAKAASVAYQIPDAAPGESYLVGHSSTITLINPAGEIEAIFTTPFDATRIASDFDAIEKYYSTR